MLLHQSTWPQIERYLQSSKGIIIPIGSTEQHGPSGLIGTDAICPEVIANQVALQDNVLVGPTLAIGIAQHHLGFPGTITLRPSTFTAMLQDYVGSLACHGFTHYYFFNGHGGNIAPIRNAFAEIYAEFSLQKDASSVVLNLCNWWDLNGIGQKLKAMYPVGHGSHATPSEIAITMYAHPDHVQVTQLEPVIAPNGPIRDAADYRRRFPDGRIGSDPSLAKAEDGETLVNLCAAALLADFKQFCTDQNN